MTERGERGTERPGQGGAEALSEMGGKGEDGEAVGGEAETETPTETEAH